MQSSVIIIGTGEMGGVFARGFLRAGFPVVPVRRDDDINAVASDIKEPALVLLAVAEKDFDTALQAVPEAWRDRLVLLQNELLPNSWQQYDIDNPTVISVWFEKKPGQDYKVLVPSPLYGPHSDLVVAALATLDIPTHTLDNPDDLLFELVRKNLYIVTTNVCGLRTGGTVSDLWQNHTILMNRVFDDVLDIQQQLTGRSFDRDHLLNAVLQAFEGDPDHGCMGRSAPQRLQRALEIADGFGLEVPELKLIAAAQS